MPSITWNRPTGTEYLSCRNSNDVTMAKFPPPPRTAQNSSGWLVSSARKSLPSAVTMSTEMTLSTQSPWVWRSQPIPPDKVRPPTPVIDTTPPGVARPRAVVSWSTSPHVAPPWTQARRA